MCIALTHEAQEWIRTIAAAVSPVLVLIGWEWVNQQNNVREGRKETRALLDRTLNALAEATDLGIKYHSSTNLTPSPSDSWRLVVAVERISTLIRLLGERQLKTSDGAEAFITLKQALTGGDFSTASWKPWPQDDLRWLELTQASHALMERLEISFFANFEKK